MTSARLLFFIVLFGLAGPANASNELYPVPGPDSPYKERVQMRHTGIILISELYIDGQPIAYFADEEVSGNPHIYWLTARRFAFLGCDSLNCDYVWRVADVETSAYKEIELPYFTNLPGFAPNDTWPTFLGSFMAYQNLLPNGNLDCFVYDWDKKQFAVRWDTKHKPSGIHPVLSESAGFGQGGKEVICRVTETWEYVPYSGEGQSGTRVPKDTKIFRRAFR